MSKDPAFLFYPNDWLGGTLGMTFEEKGAYMELLMLQFNRGHMTSHMIGQTVGQIWDKIKDKFQTDENGLYYNIRLELEQSKRKEYSISRLKNKLGKNQYSKKEKEIGHMTSHMIGHMEDENINEDINIIKDIKTVFNFKKELLNLGISEKIATDWMKVRKDKKASNTETAFNSIKREIEKSGKLPDECIKIAVERSWKGFQAEWLSNYISQSKQNITINHPFTDFKNNKHYD
jgi:uncharacterized protein YdaU (DUF1376 family)